MCSVFRKGKAEGRKEGGRVAWWSRRGVFLSWWGRGEQANRPYSNLITEEARVPLHSPMLVS